MNIQEKSSNQNALWLIFWLHDVELKSSSRVDKAYGEWDNQTGEYDH